MVELQILTSKNALCVPLPQNPCAQMSDLALSSVMVVKCEKVSPLSGCKRGSMATPWHTSVITFAIKSRMRLCLLLGKPPIGQSMACEMPKPCPQAHCEGSQSGVQL